MTPPQEARSDGNGCPSAEEIGAFLEGNLSPARTSRLLEHFAACEDCYETYLGAESFLSQAGVSTQGGTPVPPLAGFHEGGGRESSSNADRSRPFRSQGRRQRWLLSLAAILLVAVSFPIYRSLTARPPMAATALVELSPAGAQRIRGLAWKGDTPRGLNGPSPERFEVPFRLGVQVVNLQVGLRTTDADLALEAVQRILGLTGKVGYLDPVASIYKEEIFDKMISNRGPFQPEVFQEDALRAEQEMDPYLNPAFFDLGRWTAAGRFAAIAKEARFFGRREVRRFPAWLLRQKEELIDPQVRSEVEAIGETLRHSSLADADYAELQRHYEEILEVYYQGPNPSDPF